MSSVAPQPPGLITMLAELVAISSVSSTQAHLDQGNRAVVEKLAGWLDALGFETELLELPGRPDKANLLATLGSGPGGLVLAGHTDTVPYEEKLWRSDPLRLSERDNRLYGMGTCDMKGFFPIVIEAVREFSERRKSLAHPVIVLATADEESTMAGAEALVELGRPAARYAVIGEPTGLRPVYQHKSIMMERIALRGRAGHSSDPALGRNALDAMYHVIGALMAYRSSLQDQHSDPAFAVSGPTMNLGAIRGGDNPNRICSHCELDFDARLLPGMSNEQLRRDVAALLAEVGAAQGVAAELTSLFKGVEPFSGRADGALVRAAQTLTGYAPETTAFATEAPYLQQLGMETMVLGPGGIEQAHQPDEYLALSSIGPCIDLLRRLIGRFCLSAAADASPPRI